MTDDAMMRYRLQLVLSYRQLCRQIRASGRGNVFFALFFFAFAYMNFQPNAVGALAIVYLVYGAIACAEIGVGLFKWFFPSAEGVLFDALLLLLFAGLNLGIQGLALLFGGNPDTFGLVLGVLLLTGAFRRFKNYLDLRKAFAERPTSDQIAWFDDLIYEIRHADPSTDDLALDLPTKPHWKAKLLGTTAFFVARTGGEVLVAGPWDFLLIPVEQDEPHGHRHVRLNIRNRTSKPFEIDEASWANYLKWMTQYTNELAD